MAKSRFSCDNKLGNTQIELQNDNMITSEISIIAPASIAKVVRSLPTLNKPDDHTLFDNALSMSHSGSSLSCLRHVFIKDMLLFDNTDNLIRSACMPVGLSLPENLINELASIKQSITESVNEPMLWITDFWSDGYFHWMTDCLQRLIILEQNLKIKKVLLPNRLSKYSYVRESLEALGFEAIFCRSRFTYCNCIYTAGHVLPSGNYSADILSIIRRRLLASSHRSDNIDISSSYNENRPLRLWVSRIKSARRRIANEQQALSILKKYEFIPVFAEDLCFWGQIRLFGDAEIVAGLHGAGLVNALFMKKYGQLCEIRRNNDSHNNCYFALASENKLEYRYLTASNYPKTSNHHNSDVNIEISDLEQLLSDVVNQISERKV